MPKLPKENRFLDLSDYGRPLACLIAKWLENTRISPVQVTIGFILSGFAAIVCIIYHQYWAAAFFLILKSVLDAADGELARIRNKPSFTGRYFDSVADIILNAFFLLTIWHVTQGNLLYTVLAFGGLQLQGTLYNFYYVILRNKYKGDITSQIFETTVPVAMEGENQSTVNLLYRTYLVLYGGFDKVIYWLDRDAVNSKYLPGWYMTSVSIFGLGFQLLLIALMLLLQLEKFIIPFFIGYTLIIFIFIGIRKWINRPSGLLQGGSK